MEVTRILLVEDNADHASLIIDEIETEDVKREIVLMKDGQEIVDYFQKMNIDGSSEIHPQIALILLDLNLPKIDGMDVLKFIRKNPKYCSIPVIILSTNSDQKMIDEAYKNGANSYLIKPSSYEEFITKMRGVREYWLNTDLLPS